MNFNTEEYEVSLLKKIDEGFKKTAKELAKYTQIKNEDKTPEELFEQMALTERLGAIKLMKAELIRESNINYGQSISYKNTEDQEVKCLLRLSNAHEIAMDAYLKSGNIKLYDHESAELKVIKEFTPAQPTEEDIVNFTKGIIAEYLATKEEGYTPTIRDMGQIMPKVRANFPNVDGNIVRKALMG